MDINYILNQIKNDYDQFNDVLESKILTKNQIKNILILNFLQKNKQIINDKLRKDVLNYMKPNNKLKIKPTKSYKIKINYFDLARGLKNFA